MRGFGPRARAARLACVGFLAVGCAAKPEKKTDPPGPVVRKVELEGVKRFEPNEITPYLNLQPSRRVGLGEKHYYIRGLEHADARRIEDVYRSHGYYEVEVAEPTVEISRAHKKLEKQRATIHFEVREGPATIIEKLDIQWVGVPPHGEIRAAVASAATLRAGQQFGIPALDASAAAMQAELRRRGYAKAVVRKHAWVDRGKHIAIVRFEIDRGRRYRIARVDIDGLTHVPEYLVQREVEDAIGKAYDPGRLHLMERSVYAMGVFSSVSVEDGEDLGNGRMAIRVRVTESKLQRVRVGVGFGIDPVRWEQRASLLYRHDSLFGHLTRLDVRLKAGYAELPALYDPREHGPIAALNLELRKKGLLEKHLIWTAAPGIELGIWEGYQFYGLRHRLGVSRFFTRFVELGLSYNNRFTDFFNIAEALDRNRTLLGLDFRDPYFLAYVEIVGTLHLTDEIADPKNGVRFTASYDVASTYLGGQFDYQKVEPDLRAYWRPHERVQIAARSRLGFIFPYGRNPGAPIDLQFYLGGSNDVRGWPFRRLSPRVELCDAVGDDCRQIPVGGKTMVQTTLEMRVRTVADLWLAGFGDMGDVRGGIADFSPGGLMYSTGGGARYVTPIGTFRLDIGVRLNEDPRFPEPRRWALHFGLGEAF